MEKIKVPAEYNRLMPYLIAKDAHELINFTSKIFGATEKMKILRDDKSIMHAEINISDQVIMFSQESKEFPAITGSFFIYVNNVDQSYKDALALGAKSVQPPGDQDYGRSCGVEDTNGNVWWITECK